MPEVEGHGLRILEVLGGYLDSGQFKCFTCGATLTQFNAEGFVFNANAKRLYYKCPNDSCINHLRGGYRSLKISNTVEKTLASSLGDEVPLESEDEEDALGDSSEDDDDQVPEEPVEETQDLSNPENNPDTEE